MKTILKKVLESVKAKTKQTIMPQSRKNPAYKLTPAPAYWLLQPIHPTELMQKKQKQ